MKTFRSPSRAGSAGFTIVEVMISMSIIVSVIAMAMSTFMFCMRAMYKDTQRLATNASLRSFMAQISKETLDASYFYVFPYYTALDGSVDLTTDFATLVLDDAAGTEYDRWIASGDCVVLVTNVTVSGVTKIRQVRIYYRRTKVQSATDATPLDNSAWQRNLDAPLRYYETADWPAGHPSNYTLTQILDGINLNSATTGANYSADGKSYNTSAGDFTGSRLVTLKCRGRRVTTASGSYAVGDLYPIFSTESPEANASNGFISINCEFVNGVSATYMLSSSSFNYTISPRR